MNGKNFQLNVQIWCVLENKTIELCYENFFSSHFTIELTYNR